MLKIGLLGFGNVGQGVFNILQENNRLLKKRVGKEIVIKTIAVRSPEKYQHLNIGTTTLTNDPLGVINDPEISVIVELIGGELPAFDYICKALKANKHVVTANKEVISKHKNTFFELAKKHNVDILFEAAVAGGIPIIRSLKVGYAANRIDKLFGILNGTTNYILTKIEEDQKEFKTVLKDAQNLGLAEADPTMDIDGIDAAHKLVILAAVAFKADIQINQFTYKGITSITLIDIQYAKELGYCFKLLAIGERIDDNTLSFQVNPTLIPNSHQLATIRNEMNAIFITGNAVGEALLAGKGAGGSPTGSAVVSDIIDIAFDKKTHTRNLETNLQKVTLKPQETCDSQFYIRLTVKDEPNALEKVTGSLGNNKISIAKIIQKECKNGLAEIVIITHKAIEKKLLIAIKELENVSKNNSVSNWFHVKCDE